MYSANHKKYFAFNNECKCEVNKYREKVNNYSLNIEKRKIFAFFFQYLFTPASTAANESDVSQQYLCQLRI